MTMKSVMALFVGLLMILSVIVIMPTGAAEPDIADLVPLGSDDLSEPLNFDDELSAWVEVESSTPVGTSYLLWEQHGGFWADAEKDPNPGDDLLCWAATASNMMEWTGWGFVSGIDDTDDSLQYFRSHVSDQGSDIQYGIEWWFNGNLPRDDDRWAEELVEGGNFWAPLGYNWANYVTVIEINSIAMQSIHLALSNGHAVGLDIRGGGAHAITCWGFNYDPLLDPTDENFYKGVWISDSDDNKNVWNPDNTMRYFSVTWDSVNLRWNLGGGYSGWYISEVVSLAPFPDEPRPVADTGGPYVVDEGTTVYFDSGGSTDDDSMLYRWDFDGDATWDTGWVTTIIVSHTWYDDYEGTVYLEVFDGRLRDMDITTVTVNNVAPTITVYGDEIDENGMATVFGYIYDPGIYDTFELVIDWGEGSPQTINYPSGTDMFTIAHQYLDDDPTGTPYDDYAIEVSVTDDDGGVDVEYTTVTVNNLNPIPSIDLMDQPNPEFILPVIHTLDFTGSFTDVGTLDTHTAVWDWGDGTSDPGALVESGGSGTVTGSHVYSMPGTYIVTLTVTDDDTGYGTSTFEVVVVDAHGALDIMNEYIQSLDDSCFGKNADNKKKTLSNMIDALHSKIDAGAFNGTIHDLQSNLRDKMDGEIDGKAGNDWILGYDVQYELTMKIDDICAYLATFL